MEDTAPVVSGVDASHQDVQRCLSACAEDITITTGDGEVLLRGHEAVRGRFTGLLDEHPDLQTEVERRMRAGGWVVEQRRVTMGDRCVRSVVAFHLEGGRIDRVLFLDAA